MQINEGVRERLWVEKSVASVSYEWCDEVDERESSDHIDELDLLCESAFLDAMIGLWFVSVRSSSRQWSEVVEALKKLAVAAIVYKLPA